MHLTNLTCNSFLFQQTFHTTKAYNPRSVKKKRENVKRKKKKNKTLKHTVMENRTAKDCDATFSCIKIITPLSPVLLCRVMACTGNHNGESRQDLLLWMPYLVLFLNKVSSCFHLGHGSFFFRPKKLISFTLE